VKKICFLASGNGGNLKFFYFAAAQNSTHNFQLAAIADRECGSLEFSKNKGLERYIINYNSTNSLELNLALEKIKPDIIITNWHKIIDRDTVRKYMGKMINLHYSLLPAFAGLIGIEPIKLAYAQGCKYIGPTCHYVDENLDAGKIISQAIFATDIPIDRAVELMFRKGCLVLLNSVHQLFSSPPATNKQTLHDPSFRPPLSFDSSIFSEEFWQYVANS